jgi:rod shape-determining protein MreC
MIRAASTRKSLWLLLGLVLAHLVAISRQVDAGGGVSLLERSIFWVLSPLQAATAASVRGVVGVWSSYLGLRGAHRENQQLRLRLGEVEMRLQQQQRQAEEATRLRQLLELRGILPLATLGADVIAMEGLPWFRTLAINKGSRDGVRLNAPVISTNGVVGRTVRLGPHASQVQLLLDQQSGVGVRIERSRIIGVVSGQAQGGSDLSMKYVPMLADVVGGDVVVTSGLDRIFPPGLVVGRVRSVRRGSGLFKEIVVEPSARFDSLETVLVVLTTPPDDQTLEGLR